MSHETPPTNENPARIIFTIDINESLNFRLGEQTPLEIIRGLLDTSLCQMIFRSADGQEGTSIYQVAIITAGDKVKDFFDGFLPAEEILKRGIPQFDSIRSHTDAVGAFRRIEKLLQQELPKIQKGPAPIVVHLIAGRPAGDIEPASNRILSMWVPDGNILIENIYVGDSVSFEFIDDPFQWSGVLLYSRDPASDNFLNTSSEIPNSYCQNMRHAGFNLDTWSFMTVPGHTPNLLEMGFYLALSGPWSCLSVTNDRRSVQEIARADFGHFHELFYKKITG
jgi:hypothetical protein